MPAAQPWLHAFQASRGLGVVVSWELFADHCGAAPFHSFDGAWLGSASSRFVIADGHCQPAGTRRRSFRAAVPRWPQQSTSCCPLHRPGSHVRTGTSVERTSHDLHIPAHSGQEPGTIPTDRADRSTHRVTPLVQPAEFLPLRSSTRSCNPLQHPPRQRPPHRHPSSNPRSSNRGLSNQVLGALVFFIMAGSKGVFCFGVFDAGC